MLIVAGILLSLSACKNKSDKKSIIGKWKPVVVNIQEMDDEENQEIISNAVLEFRNEGQLTIFNGIRDSLLKKYAYNGNDSTLTIHDPAKAATESQHFKVNWSADTLIIKNETGEMKLLRK